MKSRNRLGLVAGLVLGFALGNEAMGQDVPVASIPTCEEWVDGCMAMSAGLYALELENCNDPSIPANEAMRQYCREQAAIRLAIRNNECITGFVVCLEVREWFKPFRQILPIDIMFAYEDWNPQPSSPGPGVGSPLDGITPKDSPVGPFTGNEPGDHGYVEPAVHPRKAPR